EPELVRQSRHRLRRRGRPQNGLGRIARQDVHDREDDQGGRQERRRENRQPLENIKEHRRKLERRAKSRQAPYEFFAASAEASRKEISDERARAMRISASRAARKSANRCVVRS